MAGTDGGQPGAKTMQKRNLRGHESWAFEGETWWSALLAQAIANRDIAAALLRAAPSPGEGSEGLADQLEVWYAEQDASGACRVAQDNGMPRLPGCGRHVEASSN